MQDYSVWIAGCTFAVAVIAYAVKITWAVRDLEKNIQADVSARAQEITNELEASQKSQDHNFGEVGAALRQYIADVEKKVREVEIWGRDNYVKIPDFERAMDRLSDTMEKGFAEIKKDIREIITKQ